MEGNRRRLAVGGSPTAIGSRRFPPKRPNNPVPYTTPWPTPPRRPSHCRAPHRPRAIPATFASFFVCVPTVRMTTFFFGFLRTPNRGGDPGLSAPLSVRTRAGASPGPGPSAPSGRGPGHSSGPPSRKGSWPAELWDSLRGCAGRADMAPALLHRPPPPMYPRSPGPLGHGVPVSGASIGQVWTRHLAPAAPASRPSSPSQFLDCACHSDSALQFLSLPSALNGVGGGLP